MKYLVTVGFVATLAAPLHASPITDQFSSFWVLGDSLSDNGNTAAMVQSLLPPSPTPAPAPDASTPMSPPQQAGVSSDGFTWAREFTTDFSNAGKNTGNLSFGGARASDNMTSAPDLLAQIDAGTDFTTSFELAPSFTVSGTTDKYADGKGGLLDRKDEWGDNPLVTIFVGGNDFLDASRAIGAGADATATLQNVSISTFLSVQKAVNDLIAEGVTDFMVMNLPDFSVIPAFDDGDDTVVSSLEQLGFALAGAANALNQQISGYLNAIEGAGSGVQFTEVDVFGALGNQAVNNPLGLAEPDDACIRVPGITDCSEYFYWDEIHPTSNGHGLVAEAARDALTLEYDLQPVPLPAPMLMLLTAMGATLTLRRKKQAA